MDLHNWGVLHKTRLQYEQIRPSFQWYSSRSGGKTTLLSVYGGSITNSKMAASTSGGILVGRYISVRKTITWVASLSRCFTRPGSPFANSWIRAISRSSRSISTPDSRINLSGSCRAFSWGESPDFVAIAVFDLCRWGIFERIEDTYSSTAKFPSQLSLIWI